MKIHWFYLLEEDKLFFVTNKGYYYLTDCLTRKTFRISKNEYENYLAIYHEH